MIRRASLTLPFLAGCTPGLLDVDLLPGVACGMQDPRGGLDPGEAITSTLSDPDRIAALLASCDPAPFGSDRWADAPAQVWEERRLLVTLAVTGCLDDVTLDAVTYHRHDGVFLYLDGTPVPGCTTPSVATAVLVMDRLADQEVRVRLEAPLE